MTATSTADASMADSSSITVPSADDEDPGNGDDEDPGNGDDPDNGDDEDPGNGDDPDNGDGDVSITLNETALDLVRTQLFSLTATVSGAEGADAEVSWATSNESIVSVNPTGAATAAIEAIGIGTATVTATSAADPSVSASVEVTVRAMTLDVSYVFEVPGEGYSGTLTGIVGIAFSEADLGLEWTFEPAGVIDLEDGVTSVSGEALAFTALEAGTVTATATSLQDPSVQDSADIEVQDPAEALDPMNVYVGAWTDPPLGGVEGNIFNPFETIQDAVDAAGDGGTIRVFAGEYSEEVSIGKALTLLGPNAGTAGYGDRVDEAVLTVPGAGAESTIRYGFHVTANNVAIDGFFIDTDTFLENPDPRTTGVHGVRVTGEASEGVTVQNNHIVNTNAPIWIRRVRDDGQATDMLIARNLIEGPEAESDQGIYLQHAEGDILDNVIRDARVGMQVQPYRQQGGGRIAGNDMHVFQVGLWFNGPEDASSDWLFENNSVLGTASPWGWPLLTQDPEDWSGIRIEVHRAGSVTFTGNTIDSGESDAPGTTYLLRQRLGNANGEVVDIGTVEELGAFFTSNSFPEFIGGVSLSDLTEDNSLLQLEAPSYTVPE